MSPSWLTAAVEMAVVIIAMVAMVSEGVAAGPIASEPVTISGFPYLEDFSGTAACSDCSIANGDDQCLGIGADLGWNQDVAGEDTAGTNWVVWDQNAPTPGTGPKTGDHTSGSGNYMWIHQGTGRADSDDDDDGAPYCIPDPSNFYNRTVGMVSPIFDFSGVASSDHIFLRFWTWMYGLRTGTLTVQLNTDQVPTPGSPNVGPWTQDLLVVGLEEDRWTEQLVELVGMQGQSSVRLRFVAEFLPRSCPFATCGSGDSTPPPEDMADQAFDDVEIFLSSSATAVSAGTEDRALWVDLSSRDRLTGVMAFANQHQAAWSDLMTALGDHRMVSWGGVSATGEAIDRATVFDYETRAYVLDQDTGQLPLPRRRGAYVTLGGTSAPDGRLAIYGGRGKFGVTSQVLMLSVTSGNFEPSPSPGDLNCTDLTPLVPNHLRFPSEGARAVIDPQDSGAFYLTFGRSLVVQVNFVSRITIDATSGACSVGVITPSASGAPPPLSRWDHVVGAWSTPGAGDTYLFVFGGRFQPADVDAPGVLDDLQIFDVTSSAWLDQLATADPSQRPLGRSGATAANNALGDKLVLFGGLDDSVASATIVYADVFVLQYDLGFQLWKRLDVGLDVATVPGRAGHTMLPMFFADTTLDPTAPVSEISEGFLIYGGTVSGGAVTNHLAKLHFGTLDLVPVSTDGGDDEDPTVAIVLGVVLPFCCLLLLLLLLLGALVSAIVAWRVVAKRRLRKRYGIGNVGDAVAMTETDTAD